MIDKLEKLMKGQKSGLSDTEKMAKMDVVKHMRDIASSALKDRIGGLKKVSVASDSPEGLKHGLDKAKEILSGGEHEGMAEGAEDPMHDAEMAEDEHDGDEAEGMPEHEASESPEFEAQEEAGHDMENLSPDDIDARIKELLALKEKMGK